MSTVATQTLFLEPQRLYGTERVEVPDEDYQIPFGQSRVVRDGKDLMIVAWSAAVELSLRAAMACAQMRGERDWVPDPAP